VWPATILGVIFLGSTRPVLGHEFYLFQALFFIAMVLFMQQRLIWCGAVIGLLFLPRGAGLLLLPLCGAWLLGVWAAHAPRDGRALVRDGLRLGGGFAVPVLPWCGYALWTFGRILPQTLDAKQVQGALGEYPTFTEQLPVWLGAWWFWDSTLMRPVQAGMWALALLGVGYAVWRARPWRFLAGWCVLYTAGYALLGEQAYWWYQLPLWFAWILFIGLGCVAALGIARAVPRYRTAATAVVAVGVAGVLGVHLALTGYKAWTYQGDWRAPLYRDVAAWLHEHSAPGATVAYGEVGYLGYYTDNRIVDLWGLVSPGLLDDAAAGDFTATFLAEPPDYYLDVRVARYAHLLPHPGLAAQYAPVHTFEDPNHDLRAPLYAQR